MSLKFIEESICLENRLFIVAVLGPDRDIAGRIVMPGDVTCVSRPPKESYTERII
jgi:hypothetical protein